MGLGHSSMIRAEKYICNLMIVGAAKSGTTALHYLLSQHPDINMSVPKETQFFVSVEKYNRGPSFHNSFFKRGSYFYHGEASPHYFSSEYAIKKIKEDISDVKIIIMLRHPIDRAWSHYRYAVKKGIEKKSFIDAVKENGFSFDHDSGKLTPYILQSNYAHFVPIWTKTFGAKNVLIVKYDDFTKDPDKCLKKICKFLKIPNFVHSLPDARLNRTSEIFQEQNIPGFYGRLGVLIPHNIKSNKIYIWLRKQLLRRHRVEHSVRVTLSSEEIEFISNLLTSDISWYEDYFSYSTQEGDLTL